MAQDEASKKAHENTLWKIAGNLVSKYYEFLPNLIKAQWDEIEKRFPAPGTQTWQAWADNLVATDRMDQPTANEIKKLINYPFPLNVIYFIGSVLAVTRAELDAVMQAHMLDKQYDILNRTRPHPAPVDNLVRSMIIDPGRSAENRAQLRRHGFSEQQIDNIILSYYKTIDEGTLRTLYLRGEITSERLYERMRELGYTDQRTSEIIRTWEVIPGPQDLLTMVAKEAFEPDIYRYIGLDEEFPEGQVQWLERQGINRGWAERYWIAHWDQPSIGQGFEMLHRGVISRSELDLLFRAVEIPRFWRDRLNQIAYSPYTRVDVRRMHDLGILDEAQVMRAYLDLGFDEEKAANMTLFTVRYNTETQSGLTRETVLSTFRDGLISRSDARALLSEQGYSFDVADFYLETAEFDRDKKILDQQIENTRDEYFLNIITLSQATSRLNSMGLRADKVQSLTDSWQLDKFKYESLPTKSDLDRFLGKGIINEGQWRDYMARLGYSFQVISWYWQDNALEQGGAIRSPTKADLKRWYDSGRIAEGEFRDEMARLGYTSRHIELYLND